MCYKILRNVLILILIIQGISYAQDINLKLIMPGINFYPGATFKLDLQIKNSGPNYNDSQLFVALTLGTGEYWFYPTWCKYPDEVDWEDISISQSSDFTKSIIPAFEWPSGAGEFSGAMFLSAIVYNGILISNLAEITFGWTEKPGPTPTPTPEPSKFAFIPSGTFQMGSPDEELCREYDESPLHSITISNNFYIQRKEVTQQEWIDIFETNPSNNTDCLNCPVENITWFDCIIYCNRLSLKEGLTPCYYSDESYSTVFDGTPPVTSGMVYWKMDAEGFRLPTEAEWEYACRSGTTTAYNSGDDISDCIWDSNLDPLAWYDNNSSLKTHPVGQKQPNSSGLYDMHGNVWEWCWDYYDDDYYESSPSEDPTGPENAADHVIRGGSYGNLSGDCRSAKRGYLYPGEQRNNTGFRIVKNED